MLIPIHLEVFLLGEVGVLSVAVAPIFDLVVDLGFEFWRHLADVATGDVEQDGLFGVCHRQTECTSSQDRSTFFFAFFSVRPIGTMVLHVHSLATGGYLR